MKRQLLVSIVVALLLLNILPFLSVKAATEPATWSKPRPTADRVFNDTLGSASTSSDGQTDLTLGVNVDKFITGTGMVPDALRFKIDLSATTRAGIDYNWSSAPYGFSWINVSTPIEMSGDDSCALFNLDAPVLYYGINYSSLYVFSNGFVSFTTPNLSSTSPSSLPNSSMPAAIVAPFWRELKLSQGGSIKTGHINYTWSGDGHWRCYQVFTWDGIPDKNGHPQTFQLLLEYRSDVADGYSYQSRIYFQYLSVTNDVATTIGVQDRIGHNGNSYSLSDISNGTAGGLNAVAYGFGYRLSRVYFAVTKSDSNAMVDLSSVFEDGTNVNINQTGNNNDGASFWAAAIEGGANALLDATGFGEVVDGLFVLWDIGASTAGAYYTPASGTLTDAGTGNDQAQGFADCWGQWAPVDGSYRGLPFDASFSDLVTWYLTDSPQQNWVDHTVNVTAAALYQDCSSSNGYLVSTSIVLDLYTGSHYLDIGSRVGGQTVSASVTGMDIWVDGQHYTTPVSGLIVTQGVHNITAASAIYANGSPRYTFDRWSSGEQGNSLPAEDIEADWNESANYVIVGDINLDLSVNILDAIILANAFGSTQSSSNWNALADLNKDGTVNILDAIILANNFGIKYVNGSTSGMWAQSSSVRSMTMDGPSILVDPSQITVFKGETFTVNVDVTSVTNLQGWEFKLYWNSTALSCTNASVVTPTIWQGSTQDDGPGLQANYNSTNGRFWWAEAANYPVSSFNGSMTIATLTFKAMQAGTTSLTLADTTLGNSTAQPIACSVSSGSVTVYSGRYMRSDTQTVNGLNAYNLSVPESTSSASATQSGSGEGAYWGIRAFVRHSNGTEQKISLDGQTGTPAAVVYREAYSGIESATVNVSQTALQSTDSLVVRTYMEAGGSGWVLSATFTTEQLNATTLQATTWTVYYYTLASYNRRYDRTTATLYWGTTTYNTRIQNLQYT